MKKIICILLALLLFTGTLAGCGKNDAAETTAASTAVETTAAEAMTTVEETTAAAQVLADEQILALTASDFAQYCSRVNFEEPATFNKAQLTLKQFMNYIKNKRVDDIAGCMNGPYQDKTSEAFLIFNGIDLDSYEYKTEKSVGPWTDFGVTLQISKSSSPLFPVGKSRWIIRIPDNPDDSTNGALISLFRNANETSAIIGINTDASNSVWFCWMVSVELHCFETMDDFNKLVANAKAENRFDSFCGELKNLLIWSKDFSVSEELKVPELEALAKEVFGITKIDFREAEAYYNTDDTLRGYNRGSGIDYPAAAYSSTYDQTTRIRTVLIDYYADGACLFKAKTMKYTLQEKADGSLKLLSTRLVYDSGYDMYWG